MSNEFGLRDRVQKNIQKYRIKYLSNEYSFKIGTQKYQLISRINSMLKYFSISLNSETAG